MKKSIILLFQITILGSSCTEKNEFGKLALQTGTTMMELSEISLSYVK